MAGNRTQSRRSPGLHDGNFTARNAQNILAWSVLGRIHGRSIALRKLALTTKGHDMARKPTGRDGGDDQSVGISSYDQMLLNAIQRGDESLETGRYIVTYREDAPDQGGEFLKSLGLRTADARDFDEQAVSVEDVGDADALIFPEIGAAVISAEAAAERELG